MAVMGRTCERCSKPQVACPCKTCKVVHLVKPFCNLWKREWCCWWCGCARVSPSVAVETSGIYNPLAEEDLQCTCIHLKEISVVYLEDWGRTAACSALARGCSCSALVLELVLPGTVLLQTDAGQAACGGGWVWSWRCLEERWAVCRSRAVGHRVTMRNMHECPRGKRWWEQSCESKSGSETRSLRVLLSLVLERVSVALAQATDSSAAGWTPPLNFKQSWALLRLTALTVTLCLFNPPCTQGSCAITLPMATASGAGSQADGRDGGASRGDSGGEDIWVGVSSVGSGEEQKTSLKFPGGVLGWCGLSHRKCAWGRGRAPATRREPVSTDRAVAVRWAEHPSCFLRNLKTKEKRWYCN